MLFQNNLIYTRNHLAHNFVPYNTDTAFMKPLSQTCNCLWGATTSGMSPQAPAPDVPTGTSSV